MSSYLTSLVTAAERDQTYWESIRDDSNPVHISGTASFYVRFLERIINGLNAISSYHTPEEFVARFLERTHFFSLQEKEFRPCAEQFVQEMVASGNAPDMHLSKSALIESTVEKMTRWYYILDAYDTRLFQQNKEIVQDLVAYDLTTIFHPGNLDAALVRTYADQFDTTYPLDSVFLVVGKALGLPESFIWFLIFKYHIPDGWDGYGNVGELFDTLPTLKEILTRIQHAPTYRKDIRHARYEALTTQLARTFRKDLASFRIYQKAEQKAAEILAFKKMENLSKTEIQHLAKQIRTAINTVPQFPSSGYDEASVDRYLVEKLTLWQHLVSEYRKEERLTEDERTILLACMRHDLLRVFSDTTMDKEIMNTAHRIYSQDRSVFLIISGLSLKMSHKMVRSLIFSTYLPQWKQNPSPQEARSWSPYLDTAVSSIAHTYHLFETIPKGRYARLTKGFTSFYCVKKAIETYLDHEYEERAGSIPERTNSLYQRLFRKQNGSTEQQLAHLEELITRVPKRVDEDTFDEILYLVMRRDMHQHRTKHLDTFLEQEEQRDSILKRIFHRFDAFTFNRIMNRNSAGLANLFGTKGFIIIIEAYLVGSGLEYLLNEGVLYGVSFLVNLGQFVSDLFLTTAPLDPATIIPVAHGETEEVLIDLSLSALARGWEMMAWWKTFISLLIPILLMFLITAYNYIFHKLNRTYNRKKSFQSLASFTTRWIHGESKHKIFLWQPRQGNLLFEFFKTGLLAIQIFFIIQILNYIGFEPTQIGLFFFLLSTICLSAYQGNKLKDEVTLGQAENISDTVRDLVFIPLIEMGRFLSGQAKNLNFIPWLVKAGVEPLYRPLVMFLQSFISFQKEKKDELL